LQRRMGMERCCATRRVASLGSSFQAWRTELLASKFDQQATAMKDLEQHLDKASPHKINKSTHAQRTKSLAKRQ